MWAIDDDQTHPVRAMAIGGRFKWDDQGETPNTMFGIAEYPNGQYVFFNVRNVNYDGYQRQVENEYYFEDGGKIVRRQVLPEGKHQGREGRRSPRRGDTGGGVRQLHRRLPRRETRNVQRQHGRCPPLLRGRALDEQLVSARQTGPVQRQGRPVRRQQGRLRALHEAARDHARRRAAFPRTKPSTSSGPG